MVRESLRSGVSFGLTSGAITTLGLIVGLASGTRSRTVVIGGIITIAVADAFSDALGIHVHEEAEADHTRREIWAATLAAFATKLLLALTFLPPVMLLPLTPAIGVSILWALVILILLSHRIARMQGTPPGRAIAEHVLIAILVVAVTYGVGEWVAVAFAETD